MRLGSARKAEFLEVCTGAVSGEWLERPAGGSVAYIGTDQAVMDLPSFRLKGRGAGVLWRGWETYRQISNRNKALVGFDWLRTKLFGGAHADSFQPG